MNLLVTGAWYEANKYITELEAIGHHVQFLQWEKDPLLCEYEWVEGVVCSWLFKYHPIEQFVNLRYIQLTSAGTDHVPVEYIKEHSIRFHNARGVYSIPMAEYAVSGVLQLYKQARRFTENQQNHRWEKIRELPELYGKTVSIVGCGSVGKECAKRFRAFGCRVVGIRKHMIHDPQIQYFDVIESVDSLDRILSEADILILAVPLTKETRHLIGSKQLLKLKKSSVIVNLARGAIVDTDALIRTLKEKGILGVVLDVFEEEPLPYDSPLWNMEHVILTPHNSFVGEGNQERLGQLIMRRIMEYNH